MDRNSIPCKGRAALAGLLEEMGLPVIHRQFCGGQVKQRRLPHITHLTEAKRGHPGFQADAPCPPSLINVSGQRNRSWDSARKGSGVCGQTCQLPEW